MPSASRLSRWETIGGLKTTENNQVLTDQGTVIDGLYAAGELINGKYFNQVYVSGDAQAAVYRLGNSGGSGSRGLRAV